MKRKCKDDRGFLSLKTGLMTAGAFLATASMGTAILVGLPTAQSTNVFTDDKSGFCVTATLENDDSYFAQRGNCGNEEVLEPAPLPEVPEITPEPTPTPEPEPVLPPPPPPVINSDQIMVATFNTSLSAGCQEITLPISGAVNTNIQWDKDSIPEKFNTDHPTHIFTSPHGPKEIVINGTFDNWGTDDFNAWNDSRCIVSVDRWEKTETKNLNSAFNSAINLKHVEEIPSTTTILSHAFSNITRNFTLGNIQTSNVTNMNSMFYGASFFNQSLNLDTSNVTDMRTMFYQAKAFNHPLNFNTSNVTTMQSMFQSATAFNQTLNFDTSSVQIMAQMFYGATGFNSSLTFDTRNVIDMRGMFFNIGNFNQPLNFNTSNVIDMQNMFSGARLFNQDLSHWDVRKVTKKDSFSTGTNWKLPKPNFK